jgi:hypothetical protein
LKKYKLPGADQILAELIQAGGETLYSKIHTLIDSNWNKEELPQHWTESIIVPVYKDNKTDSSNYRGISLLSTSYKIVSNILLSRLSPYVDEIIWDHQCGFQRDRPIIDQIVYIHQIPENKWEYIGAVYHVFMDFKKE